MKAFVNKAHSDGGKLEICLNNGYDEVIFKIGVNNMGRGNSLELPA